MLMYNTIVLSAAVHAAMAPRKRTTKQKKVDEVKMKKVEAFLQDFDGEGNLYCGSAFCCADVRNDDMMTTSEPGVH